MYKLIFFKSIFFKYSMNLSIISYYVFLIKTSLISRIFSLRIQLYSEKLYAVLYNKILVISLSIKSLDTLPKQKYMEGILPGDFKLQMPVFLLFLISEDLQIEHKIYNYQVYIYQLQLKTENKLNKNLILQSWTKLLRQNRKSIFQWKNPLSP